MRAADKKLRVLIVDDDPRFGYALTALLETEGFEVVGHATNGAEGVAAAEKVRPDVVTMDLDMPEMNGVEATCRVTALGIPVVVVSGSTVTGTDDAIAAGATATLTKREALAALPPLLRTLRE